MFIIKLQPINKRDYVVLKLGDKPGSNAILLDFTLNFSWTCHIVYCPITLMTKRDNDEKIEYINWSILSRITTIKYLLLLFL